LSAARAGTFPNYGEADWIRCAEQALKGASFDRLRSSTTDAIPLAPLYAPAQGPRALRADGRWRIFARMDNPSADDANVQALEDLSNGADGLQVIFAGSPGGYGYGLRGHDSATLRAAFDGVAFDTGTRFELDLGAAPADRALAFAGFVERSGAKPAETEIAFGLDPVQAGMRGAPTVDDGRRRAAEAAAVARDLRDRGFAGPFFVADARGAHNAGGTPAQELAFALAAAAADLRALADAGFSLEEARAGIGFRLAADADQFATLAKFRALRLLWACVEEACGLAPRFARVHAESSWSMMTARDPYVNVMRGASAAFAAGLGGADGVSVLPHTLGAGFPDALARRLARNGQLILLRESNLGFVADPAAGAGVFEALTSALCEKAWTRFQEIEAAGGLFASLASGAFQDEIGRSAASLMRDVARLKTPITGVSAHPDLAGDVAEVALASPDRSISAGEAGALVPFRLAEPFERLRDASDAALSHAGARPKAYLAAIGPIAAHGRRVAFAREFFEAGGIETIAGQTPAGADEAAEHFRASGAAITCLCGSDEGYREHAAAFANALRAADARAIVYAGRPGEHETGLREAGVTHFIFAGMDAVAALNALFPAP
jgi:methylmalonyl-CoA mutase